MEGVAQTEYVQSDGTGAVLRELARQPDVAVRCLFGDDWAISVWHMPNGCVALSGSVFAVQALCLHHSERAQPLAGGMRLLADLSAEGAWGRHNKLLPALPVGFDAQALGGLMLQR